MACEASIDTPVVKEWQWTRAWTRVCVKLLVAASTLWSIEPLYATANKGASCVLLRTHSTLMPQDGCMQMSARYLHIICLDAKVKLSLWCVAESFRDVEKKCEASRIQNELTCTTLIPLLQGHYLDATGFALLTETGLQWIS